MHQQNKKKLALLLTAVSLLGLLSGCGQKAEAGASVTPGIVETQLQAPETEQEEAVEPQEVVAPEPEEVVEPETLPEIQPTQESATVTQPEAPVAQEIETTFVEEEIVAIEQAKEDVVVEASVEMASTDLAAIPLGSTPVVTTLMPVASGTTVYKNTKAEIDASNATEGYVMIRSLENTTAKLKIIVTGPTGLVYYYNLTNDGSYEVFPLSDGNGTYLFQICKNVSGTSYAISHSASIKVTLENEYAPFLLPNQYVNYISDGNVVAVAAQLTSGLTAELPKIQAVYNYVVTNFTYDSVRASTVQSGYLPDLESVLYEKKGICFDYAALMTGMLRSQGIPCKLVVGYAGTTYHAWINAYSTTEGWLDSVIYFDGTNWKLMDPTFASSAGSSDSIMQYIGNGANYTAKYLY